MLRILPPQLFIKKWLFKLVKLKNQNIVAGIEFSHHRAGEHTVPREKHMRTAKGKTPHKQERGEKALAINTCYFKIPMSKKTPTKLRSQDLFVSAAPENV